MISLKMGAVRLGAGLLGALGRDELRVPSFQRPYVWSLEDVNLLVDSILRRYPLGNLVFLQAYDAGVVIPVREQSWSLPPEDPARSRLPVFVLDGQQRLLTVIKLFLTGEFRVVLPMSAESRFEARVVRADEVDLAAHFDVSRLVWERGLAHRAPDLRDRMAARDPHLAALLASSGAGGPLWRYAHDLMGSHRDAPAFNLALSLTDDFSQVDLPYYNLEVSGPQGLAEAVSVFRRLNMSGVPVDVEHLQSLADLAAGGGFP